MEEAKKEKKNKKEDVKRRSENRKKLTPRQQKFIVEYVKYGDAKRAAISAGYSKKTAKAIGSENLSILDKEIRAYTEKKIKSKIASADEVLEFLTSVMRGKIKEEQIVVVGTGKGYSEAQIIKKHATTTDRTRAAKELAKRYCLTPDTVNIVSSNSVEDLKPLSDLLRYNADEMPKEIITELQEQNEDDDNDTI